MICDCEDTVETVQGQEFDDKVHGNGFKREGSRHSRDRAMSHIDWCVV